MSKKPSKAQGRKMDTEDEMDLEIKPTAKVDIVEEDGGHQTTVDAKVDRRLHCWFRRRDGSYKCVLCGGISRTPSYNRLPEKVEKLTHEERAMRLPEDKRRTRDSHEDRPRRDEGGLEDQS